MNNTSLQKAIQYALFICGLSFAGSLLAEPLDVDVIDLNVNHLMGQHDKTTKLRPELIKKIHQFETQNTSRIHLKSQLIKNKSDSLIVIDAIAKGDPRILLNDLIALGLQSTAIHGRIISGQFPLTAFDKLDSLQSLNQIKLGRMITAQGTVTSKGDRAQKSDVARQSFPVDGSGVTIGVISDSYDCLGGASKDKQSKDLPEQAVSVEEALDCTGKTDEGRALMQIIHDVAPGAHLVFHSGSNGLANAANAILTLAFKHKAHIIIDDKKSLSANFFQEDALSQAVDKVVKAGVVYVTAAGNSGRNAYQSPYTEYINTAFQLNAHDFDPGSDVDIYQRLAVPEGLGFLLLLQWDSPAYSISGAPGTQTDLDIFIFNEARTEVLASSTFFNPEGSGQSQFDLMITKASGSSPSLLKYIIVNSFDGIIQEFKTDSSGLFGHANSVSAITVGAANYSETPAFGTSPPLLQYYSSAGGVPIMLDLNGVVLSKPIVPEKPDIVAPDDVSTTFFGVDTDDDGMPNFAGTSAAAPHAAGVVALLLEINPELQPVDIKKILQSTSIDIVQRNNEKKTDTGNGFDFDSGYGLIDAAAAVDLSKNYQASPPPKANTGDTAPIIVNDSNQTGGGILDLYFLFVILIFMAPRYYPLETARSHLMRTVRLWW